MYNEQINIASQRTAGADLDANYTAELFVWRTTFVATYNPVQNLAVTVMERLRSSLAWTGDPMQIVSASRIPSVAYTDLNLSYQIKRSDSQTELFFNVQNLFNKQPPPTAFLGANGAVGSFGGFAYGDDPIGAYFTAGVRYRR